MSVQSKMLAVLEDGDHAMYLKAWPQLFPHLSERGPKTLAQAEIAMHHARTQAEPITFAKRAYSHRWLTERNIPSGLPDKMRPRAERMYPKVAVAIGIAVSSQYPVVADAIRTAMENAAKECQADDVTDTVIIRAHMQAARKREKQGLGLVIAGR